MSSGTRHYKVTVVGAGLGGALMAAHLGQAGHEVEVYERRGDPRGRGPLGGKSINLAISTRGLYALGEVGLADDILKIAIPMRGRMIHGPRGELAFQPYGTRADDLIHSVSRGDLNVRLIEAAAAMPNVRHFFDQRCRRVDLDTGALECEHTPTHESRTVANDFVVGADGAFSAVRRSLQRLDRFNYSQEFLEHGYKELSIPAKADGRHALESNALHIWPRRAFMMIALPNVDGSFTCTLFFPFEGPKSFAKLRTDADVERFFASEFPDAQPLMPTLLEDFNTNPTASLVTVRCGPWHMRDKVVLLGDACHAVVPFYGQGANAAFEDCTVLSEALARGNGNLGAAFARYDERRRRHVNVLADLAIHNFIEMRDHTGSNVFLMKKKLEKWLHRNFPKWFVPLYSMVTFSRIPYGDAVRRARKQWRVVAGVAAGAAVSVIGVLARLLLK